MAEIFKAACVQNCATADVAHNMAVTLELTREAAAQGASLIALPEYFSGLDAIDGLLHPVAFPEQDHPVLPAFSEEARKLGVWILLGSLGVKSADGRIYNRSYLLDASGAVAARYDKIHMFDVNLGDGEVYKESATVAPGSDAVLAQTPWGGLGLSICYDVRFAPLYRILAKAGASMLAVPAAFTKVTGEAHWHVLNRARAIEHACFVIAPGQYGTLSGGGECFGHSLIIDPWGKVLADGGDGPGVILAEIDPEVAVQARSKIPALKHDREIFFLGSGRDIVQKERKTAAG